MKMLALGGNLGPVLKTFDRALQSLQAHGVEVVAVSGAYHTVAVTLPGASGAMPPYWNAVCQLHTGLACEAMLELCQGLEREAGRVAGPRWGARPLDLDLLLWDDAVRSDARLTLPHPRLHERLFVLRPLHELAPREVVPGQGVTVEACLARFTDRWSGIMMHRACWQARSTTRVDKKHTPKNVSKLPRKLLRPNAKGASCHLGVDTFAGQNTVGELMFCDGAGI